MSEHLSLEAISALVEEPESVPGGAAHLERCGACRHEYEQLSRMRMALSAVGDLDPPEGQWARILDRLTGAGVPEPGAPPGASRTPEASGALGRVPAVEDPGRRESGRRGGRRWSGVRWVLQAAAVLALFAGGLLVGRVVRQPPTGRPLGLAGEIGAGPESRVPTASPVSDAEAAYLRTVADLAGLRSPGPDGADVLRDPAAAAEQLARLDAVRDALRDALERAPADPVLNNLLFEVADERETLSRQLAETLRLAELEYR